MNISCCFSLVLRKHINQLTHTEVNIFARRCCCAILTPKITVKSTLKIATINKNIGKFKVVA